MALPDSLAGCWAHLHAAAPSCCIPFAQPLPQVLLFPAATNYTAEGSAVMEMLPGNTKTLLSIAGWWVLAAGQGRPATTAVCQRKWQPGIACNGPYGSALREHPSAHPHSPVPYRPFCAASNQLVAELALKSTQLGEGAAVVCGLSTHHPPVPA